MFVIVVRYTGAYRGFGQRGGGGCYIVHLPAPYLLSEGGMFTFYLYVYLYIFLFFYPQGGGGDRPLRPPFLGTRLLGKPERSHRSTRHRKHYSFTVV